MLINNETDYAFRIMRALTDGERHTVTDLCDCEAIPQQFAYQIIRKLAAGGLIKSTRGAKGGIELIVDQDETTMLDIVEATDSDRYVTDCLRPGYKCSWKERRCEHCRVHEKLFEIQKKLDIELDKVTLRDMASEKTA